VVSLATLFPLSVVRTVQATQLTNAANLRYNAEARIDMDRTILTANALPLAPVTPPPATEPKTPSVYLIDPLGWNIAAYSNVPTYYRLGGATGIPRWNAGLNTEAAAAELVTLPDSWTRQVEEIPTSVTAVAAAPPVPAYIDVTFPNNVDLTSVPDPAASPSIHSRVVLFSIDKRQSQVLRILDLNHDPTPANGGFPTMAATPPQIARCAGTLPTWYTAATPAYAWVETRERRYTWLLNVRRYGNRANVEVVTFFGREATTDDEQPYPATFVGWVGADGAPNTADDRLGADNQPGIAGFDDDGNGTVDDATEKGWPGSDDNRTIYNVNWTTTRPTIRKGGWVLDATNGRWYRIRAIYDPVTHTPVPSLSEFSGTSVDLVVDKDLLETSGAPMPAVFLRGVIDVFPIGTKEF